MWRYHPLLQAYLNMTKKFPLTQEPSLRADAARNRERILAAAEEVFLERGADASLDDIAKRAKVGIGTLYRRFPTRDALLAATNDERLMALAEASRGRDDKLDPDASVRAFVRDLVAHASHYRGLAAALGTVLKSGTRGCHASGEEARRLLLRAQKAGVIRRDISVEDLVCMVTAISLSSSWSQHRRGRLRRSGRPARAPTWRSAPTATWCNWTPSARALVSAFARWRWLRRRRAGHVLPRIFSLKMETWVAMHEHVRESALHRHLCRMGRRIERLYTWLK